MIAAGDRTRVVELVAEAVGSGCRKDKACEVLGLSLRTVQRWQRDGGQDRRCGTRAAPANRLSEAERTMVLSVLNAPAYRDKSPHQVVALLADEGCYLASESTMYRILRAARQLAHRLRSAPARRYEPLERVAAGPNEIWSWDITFLRSPVRGLFFYLYLMVDVYSRKIVAFSIHEEESAALASALAEEACYLEGVKPGEVVLHADNGAPMKGATMLATLQRLGVVPSFSRPCVSDDNPYSEALFRTLKYRPDYPEWAFASIAAARAWVEQFVRWYNTEHRHSALKFVTPEQRHQGRDIELLARRHATYQAARACHPQRWSGATRNWQPAEPVTLPTFRPKRIAGQRIIDQAA
ncbi:MAG: IS3 family transposase [Anaerolineales bacterium]